MKVETNLLEGNKRTLSFILFDRVVVLAVILISKNAVYCKFCRYLFVIWFQAMQCIVLRLCCRDDWKRECLKLLDSPLWWDDCQSRAPETAEGLRITLSIMAGTLQNPALLSLVRGKTRLDQQLLQNLY